MYDETDLTNAYDSGYESAVEDMHELILMWEGEFSPSLVVRTLEKILGWKGHDDDLDDDYYNLSTPF